MTAPKWRRALVAGICDRCNVPYLAGTPILTDLGRPRADCCRVVRSPATDAQLAALIRAVA